MKLYRLRSYYYKQNFIRWNLQLQGFFLVNLFPKLRFASDLDYPNFHAVAPSTYGNVSSTAEITVFNMCFGGGYLVVYDINILSRYRLVDGYVVKGV